MKFFDSLIADVEKTALALPQKSFDKGDLWKDAGSSQVIMRRDTAFELEGVGFNLVTTADISDEIVVVGDDLPQIKENRSFARISVIQIDDEDDEQKAYNLIRKIEYVKYHCFPDGYMMRSASSSQKEAVRVAKYAVKAGIDFKSVGSLLTEKYKEIPSVKAVKIIFVTNPNADYSSLSRIAEKGNEITKTLNHIINSVNFDCDTCNLKAVCDEVEGMRELHFGNGMK